MLNVRAGWQRLLGPTNEQTARFYCLFQPLQTPSIFSIKSNNFTWQLPLLCVFQQTFWLANPDPFSPVQPGITKFMALRCVILQCALRLGIAHTRFWNNRRRKKLLWTQGFQSHMLKWYHIKDNPNRIFLAGKIKILLLLCSVTKPLTSAPCAKCVSDK